MPRKALLILLLTLSRPACPNLVAQKKKSAPPPAAKAPARSYQSFWRPITTATGLQYWDIKKGTGTPA